MFRPRNKKQLRFQGVDVDTLSGEYENGSALHISATNLGLEAAKVLLTYGADPQVGWSNHYTCFMVFKGTMVSKSKYWISKKIRV